MCYSYGVKPCVKCGSTKRYKSGRCGPCAMAYRKGYRQSNIERERQRDREVDARRVDSRKTYRAGRARVISEYSQSYWKRNAERLRLLRIEREFGLSPEDYGRILEAQEYKCAICLTPESEMGRRLSVDHCHDTGRVRGLLCTQCNTSIGMLKESPEIIARAARYVRRSKKAA